MRTSPRMSRLVAAAWIAATFAAAGAAGAEPLRARPVEERVLLQLQRERATAGLAALRDDVALAGVARARAEHLARIPEDRRLAEPWRFRDDLEAAGIRRWRRAYPRLAVLTGGSLVDRIVTQWKGLPEAWGHVLDRRVGAAGLAGTYAADGSYVFVAVLLEELDPLPPVEELESAVVRRVNEIREREGLPPLAVDPALAAVARRHSETMATRGFFDHVDPDGRSPGDRLRASSIPYRRVAENLGFNHRVRDPVGNAVRNWMESPGHRANIEDGELRATGVGVAVSADGKVWFTQLFVEPLFANPTRRPEEP